MIEFVPARPVRGNARWWRGDDLRVQATSWLPPWGTDPETFGAWGQWAGAIASFLAVVVALGLALAEGRRRRRELADRQAAQARTIAATVNTVETLNADQLEVSVRNYGQLPISEVAILDVSANALVWRLNDWEIHRPGVVHHRSEGLYQLAPVIGPNESSSAALRFRDQMNDEVDASTGAVTFTFVDADGLRWRRHKNGPPVRVLSKVERNRLEFRRLLKIWAVFALITVPIGVTLAVVTGDYSTALTAAAGFAGVLFGSLSLGGWRTHSAYRPQERSSRGLDAE
ncbi:hypothetical protein [Amycolatopsis thermophila]|uniref:Uncharacterized protein n=1 Tax=Amycolatopsis thermophila TaxID=206084 RepID=A0ABU0EMW8_9PSEU|nr:hypothetical protein [Amycolatopsis thermophila]MDQ0376617.1 hypothetical protein [Amycolatopsis thermophila]